MAIGCMCLFGAIWIALKERSRWPLGFKPGFSKTIGLAVIVLSMVAMSGGFLIAAIGQARLLGW